MLEIESLENKLSGKGSFHIKWNKIDTTVHVQMQHIVISLHDISQGEEAKALK